MREIHLHEQHQLCQSNDYDRQRNEEKESSIPLRAIVDSRLPFHIMIRGIARMANTLNTSSTRQSKMVLNSLISNTALEKGKKG